LGRHFVFVRQFSPISGIDEEGNMIDTDITPPSRQSGRSTDETPLGKPPSLHRQLRKREKYALRAILAAILVIGTTCISLFTGVGEVHGQDDKTPNTHKPPTHTPRPPDPTDTPVIIPTDPPPPTNTSIAPTNTSVAPTNTAIVPTNTVSVPTGTSVPPNTPNPSWTLTATDPCTFGLTPTATDNHLPTCLPTPTQTPTIMEISTDTPLPGGPTATTSFTRTSTPTDASIVAPALLESSTAPAPATESTAAPSGPFPAEAIPSVNPSTTPTEGNSDRIGPAAGMGSNPVSGASGIPFLLLIASLMTGAGIFSAFGLRSRREVYGPAPAGGGSAFSTAIHPATVGAAGFSAWLIGQVPMLTQGEQVVLSKVRNGIGSALRRIGGASDLLRIIEFGPQERIQLTADFPFPAAGVRRTGYAG
jgi:hypothetical protein